MTTYSHTQRAPYWTWLGAAIISAELVAAWILRTVPVASITLVASAIVIALLFASFRELTVSDAGDRLKVQFGPLPLLGTKIRYSKVTGVEVARSKVLDGWGIHWIPGRGWTYNLWGFDCVELQLGSRRARIGTDQPDQLAEFLRHKLAEK